MSTASIAIYYLQAFNKGDATVFYFFFFFLKTLDYNDASRSQYSLICILILPLPTMISEHVSSHTSNFQASRPTTRYFFFPNYVYSLVSVNYRLWTVKSVKLHSTIFFPTLPSSWLFALPLFFIKCTV